jgi:hypothetical protein
MKRLALVVAAVSSFGCTSIQSTLYAEDNIVATGGKARGIVQVDRATLTLFLDFVDVVKTDWDTTTQLLVNEAKGMGSEKVQIVSAHTSPRGGVWALACILACVNSTEMVGLAVEPDAK